jgi:hypothetical protein
MKHLETVELTLVGGEKALIDLEDLPRVAPLRTYALRQSSGHTYVLCKPADDPKAKIFRLHRFILQAKPGQCVDHVNGNGLDNRKSNLRLCTNAENRRNSAKHRDGAAKYKGIIKLREKWQAGVSVGGLKHRLGPYPTEEDAASAYNIGALELHGEFARLNEIPETYYDHPRQDCYLYQFVEGCGPLVGLSGRRYCCLCWREIGAS